MGSGIAKEGGGADTSSGCWSRCSSPGKVESVDDGTPASRSNTAESDAAGSKGELGNSNNLLNRNGAVAGSSPGRSPPSKPGSSEVGTSENGRNSTEPAQQESGDSEPGASRLEQERSSAPLLDAPPKKKTKAKKKPTSTHAPAAPAPLDPKLVELLATGSEILPPFGVLRVTLETEKDLKQLVAAIADGNKLIATDLQKAATGMGEKTRGRLFQALVVEGVKQLNSSKKPHPKVPLLPPSPKKNEAAMYAGREDNAAGKSLNIKKVPGGRKAGRLLAARVMNVVQLLRIKLEDDGDLLQAEKTLSNCQDFFAKVKLVGQELGHTSLHATVMQLM